MKDIGKNIKNIRQSQKMTQEALANALYVTRQTISNYENGRSRPDLDMLIKIAEVLKTDVNTIIYGPPMPQSKKDAYKWTAISLGVLAILWILYFAIGAAFDSPKYTYEPFPGALKRLILFPASMFVLGWTLLHILSLFTGLEQIKKEKGKILRRILFVVGCTLIFIPIPEVLWSGVAFYHSITRSSVSMTFPDIPIYQEIFWRIVILIDCAPFTYSILGGLFWLFGLPSTQRQAGHTQATTDE